MNTFSILINDILTALSKACVYDIYIGRHGGFTDEGRALSNGLFGFESSSVGPAEKEYLYLGYQAFVNRIR